MGKKHSGKEITGEDRFKIGTLKYTKFGLFTLFSWLLWGDFCYHIMEKVGHSILPLQLQSIGMSNFTLSLIATMLPNTLGFIVGPTVSYKSDRYRSKWGRRIPFMALTAPFLCFFLVGMGYTEDIAVWLRDSEGLKNFQIFGYHVTAHAALLFIVGFLVLGFAFFNEFVSSVYWYLFADVVPHAYLGRFMGLFRMITSVSNIFFMAFVFPHAETHAKEIYLGGAILYFVGFGLMCWRVKEGEYPAEEETEEEKKPGFFAKAKIYINECFFSHPIYLNYYLFQSIWAMGVGGTFTVLFAKQIGLTLTQVANVNIFMNIVHFFVTYPAGVIADKFHPMRLMVFITFMSIPGAFLAFYYKTDFPSYVLLGMLWLPVNMGSFLPQKECSGKAAESSGPEPWACASIYFRTIATTWFGSALCISSHSIFY
jgi:maltose/moltooligosaccharide transporter